MKSIAAAFPNVSQTSDRRAADGYAANSERQNSEKRQEPAPERVETLLRRYPSLVHEIE
jgi:hypothetical protein